MSNKFADRLKFSATGTSAATITPGAAVTKYRTLSQALATGELSVGDTNIPLVVEDSAGNWESGFYRIDSGPVLTRTQINSSSNGGAAVTFNGTLTVMNASSAASMNWGYINPHDPGFDIIICAGQSNMQGQMSPDSTIDVSDPRVYAWGGCPSDSATYQKIALAADPLKHYTIAPGMGPATWFGKTYAGMIPSNRKVLLVPVAKGATYLVAQTAEWAPGDGTGGGLVASGYLYENAITQANAALAAAQLLFPNSRIVGTIWLQGESDAAYTVSQIRYAAALKTLIQGFRNRMTGAQNSWFLIAGMIGEYVANVSGTTAAYGPIDQAHQQVAAEVARCAYFPGVSGYQFSPSNTVHYNTTGARIMGCGLATVFGKSLGNRGVDSTAPTMLSASVSSANSSTVAVLLSEPFDPAYPPVTSAYTVTGHTVSSVTGSGNVLYLSVSPAFVNGEAARTVSFTAPGNGIRDFAGNLMPTQLNLSITNSVAAVDSTPPTLSGATVANATPSTLTMTASETLDTNFTPATSAFTVSGHTVTSVTVNAGTVVLGLGEPFVSGEAARTVAYTQPASNGFRDLVGNLAVSFSNLPVANNVSAADTQPPTFVSAQIANATPTVVQITMSETLAASNPPASAFTVTEGGTSKSISSATVSGTTVSVTCATAFSSGTSVLITYTDPGTDPRIKDPSNNATATFTAQPVTNNVASGGNTPIRFTGLTNMTETSATPPYAYAEASTYTNYSGANNGAVSSLALAGDGMIMMQLGNVSTQPMVGFRINTTVGNYASIPYDMMAKTTGYSAYQGTATTVVSNRIPANGDWVKFVRSGTTIAFYVSPDAVNWTLIFTWTGVVSGPLYCQIMGIYTSASVYSTFTAPQGTGWA